MLFPQLLGPYTIWLFMKPLLIRATLGVVSVKVWDPILPRLQRLASACAEHNTARLCSHSTPPPPLPELVSWCTFCTSHNSAFGGTSITVHVEHGNMYPTTCGPLLMQPTWLPSKLMLGGGCCLCFVVKNMPSHFLASKNHCPHHSMTLLQKIIPQSNITKTCRGIELVLQASR